MPEYGYFLATEEFGPAELIEQAVGVPPARAKSRVGGGGAGRIRLSVDL